MKNGHYSAAFVNKYTTSYKIKYSFKERKTVLKQQKLRKLNKLHYEDLCVVG